MRLILKTVKWTVIIFAVVIFGFALWIYIGNKIFIGKSDKVTCSYLDANKLVLNSNLDNYSDDFFRSDFFESDVFLLGEIHGFADAQKIDKSLFVYLHQKAGVKYYLAEMDSLRANLLNTFLHSEPKDTVLLKSIVHSIKKRIPQQSSRELYEKWSDLYDYNRMQEDSLKISVLGIDKDFDDYSREISRDSMMMKNFIHIINEKGLSKEKFYGFLGLAHVLQSETGKNRFRYFAARLCDSKYRVKSFVNFTLDSEMFMPEDSGFPVPEDESLSFFNSDGPLVLVKGINDLKKVTDKNTITLFNIENTDSPYWNSQKLGVNKTNFIPGQLIPSDRDTPTVCFFQYVFLLRNSKALRPLNTYR
jgi:hypothetical protein